MGKTVIAKFNDELQKYKLLCEIVTNIFALEDLKDNDKGEIARKHLLIELLFKLDDYNQLDGTYIAFIPIEGTIDKYESIVTEFERRLYQKYSKKLGSTLVNEALRKVSRNYSDCISRAYITQKEDKKINLYDLIKEDEKIFLQLLFSNAEFNIRKDLFIRNLIDPYGYKYYSFEKIKEAFSKHDMEITNPTLREAYKDRYDYYIEYISNNTTYDHKIIAAHSRDTDYCIGIMKSGLAIDYYVLIGALKDSYLNPDLLNTVIDNYRMYGERNEPNPLNLINRWHVKPKEFEEHIGITVANNISDLNKMFSIKFKFDEDFYPRLKEGKLFVEITNRLKLMVKEKLESHAPEQEIEEIINSVYAMVVSQATTQKETDTYTYIGQWVVNYALWYVEDYHKIQKKKEALLQMEADWLTVN